MRRSTVGMPALGTVLAGAVIWQAVGQAGPRPQASCPITGQRIDPQTSPHVDWEGQQIYFANAAAVDQFRRDPEAAFVKIAAEHVQLENIETNCPVSDESLLGGGSGGPVISYKGRTIRFCCPDCPPKFQVDPTRDLARLPGEQVASR